MSLVVLEDTQTPFGFLRGRAVGRCPVLLVLETCGACAASATQGDPADAESGVIADGACDAGTK